MIMSSLNQKETTLWTFHKITSLYKILKLSVDNQNITWYDGHILINGRQKKRPKSFLEIAKKRVDKQNQQWYDGHNLKNKLHFENLIRTDKVKRKI